MNLTSISFILSAKMSWISEHLNALQLLNEINIYFEDGIFFLNAFRRTALAKEEEGVL